MTVRIDFILFLVTHFECMSGGSGFNDIQFDFD